VAYDCRAALPSDSRAIRRDVIVNRHSRNARQTAAVEHLLSTGRLDIRAFGVLCPGVSLRTLQRDLSSLETKGILEPEGDTNNLTYVASGKW
jgi:DNA-binding HxlR family transcriptional regulator